MTIDDIIRIFKLEKHPLEGGFFTETYRSTRTFPEGGNGQAKRSLSTAIYYLITPDSFSEIHRLDSDEIFHFYLGDPVEMLQLYPEGGGRIIEIGNDIQAGFLPQVLVPRFVWQGCRLVPGGRLALMGTTMAPGFDYARYESGKGDELKPEYPEFREMIEILTRK